MTPTPGTPALPRSAETDRFRRTAAACCLIAAPLMMFVGGVMTPAGDEEPAAYLAALAANPVRAELSAALSYVGFVLLVPAVFALLHLLRHRAGALGHVAGTLAVLGAVGFPATVSTNFYDLALARSTDRDPALAVLRDVAGMTGASLVLLAALGGLSLGLLALGVALWRAGVARAWVPAAILLGLVVLVLGGADPVLMSLGYLPLLAALGSLGVGVLRMSTEEWEHGADHHRSPSRAPHGGVAVGS